MLWYAITFNFMRMVNLGCIVCTINKLTPERIQPMAAEIINNAESGILEIKVSGKLTHEDYELFVPETERLIAAGGKLRILLQMHDFHGWEVAALWDDIKFDLKHFNDIERLAIVGESKWEKGMSIFCKPFTTAKIQYFDISKLEDARTWIAE